MRSRPVALVPTVDRVSERIAIRAGMGLGDALYLQSVVRHLVEQGHALDVCTAWPDVFLPLKGKIRLAPFRRDRVNRVAHYTGRKRVAGTDQFEDCCLAAGIGEPVDLRLDWTVRNPNLLLRLKNTGKPVVVVQLPRSPMGRSDGFGAELLPDCHAIQQAIDALGGRAFVVQVGKGEPLYRFSGIDLDLANTTSVCDLLDVASVAHGFIGYVSFLIPLAESFARPALLVWSRRGVQSPQPFIRAITPQKILHRASSRHLFDDCTRADMGGAVDGLLEQIASV